MAILSLQSKEIPNCWACLNNQPAIARSNLWRFWTSAGSQNPAIFFAQKSMEIGVFFCLEVPTPMTWQTLKRNRWMGKKSICGKENLELWVSMISMSQWVVCSSNFFYLPDFQWLCLTFSSLEFSMPRRHLCDLLLVPLELKRLGDDECFVLPGLKLCLLEATSSIIFCEFFSGIRAAMGSFLMSIYMWFTDIFSTSGGKKLATSIFPTPTTGVGRTAQSDRSRLG